MALGGVPATAIAYLNEEVHRAHAAMAAGSYVAGTTLGGLAGITAVTVAVVPPRRADETAAAGTRGLQEAAHP